MTIDRRNFVLGSLAAGVATACRASADRSAAPAPVPLARPVPPPARKSILVLGGTGFLGPHVVTAALARGHTVTSIQRPRSPRGSPGPASAPPRPGR